MFFVPAYMRAVTPLLTANHHAEPELYDQPEGLGVEDARHPHRLAHPGLFYSPTRILTYDI